MRSSKAFYQMASAVVVGALVSCAHPDISPPITPSPVAHRSPPESSTTTTTAAPVLDSVHTSNMSISGELMRACNIHFNDVTEAPKFDLDKSELRADDAGVLAQVATCVTTGPLKGRGIVLVGRADPRGEEEYNYLLGDHRAATVRERLSSLGVNADKLRTTSRGKLDATGFDEATWQRDRRVDVQLEP
jgi:peptidoglycan-associated lipoprotein